MTADVISLPLVPDFIARLEARLLRDFAEAANEWSQCVLPLTRWEDDHLLDAPTSELLDCHRKTLERLLRFGEFLATTSGQAGFPDQQTAAIVTATLQTLRDKLALWHRHTAPERVTEILQAVFNES